MARIDKCLGTYHSTFSAQHVVYTCPAFTTAIVKWASMWMEGADATAYVGIVRSGSNFLLTPNSTLAHQTTRQWGGWHVLNAGDQFVFGVGSGSSAYCYVSGVEIT